ncbi:uncharacterized protein LOC116027003 [Ipomoea triloba]|uniref:uncharacterized protein LOC116027003 n=1 Tax=Ipomoea triloba TaxID=35885 RepID=UPI00125D8FFB|nr:uncharacterized protein LOC116027003 [Ipomoea triloba]
MAKKVERQITLENLNIGSMEISQANTVSHNQNAHNELVVAANLYNERRYSNPNKGEKCTYCGMSGHTVEKCYNNHGYPPKWISRFKSKGKQAAAINTTGDSGTTSDQVQKLITLLQAQIGQSLSMNTAAAVALIPKFNEEDYVIEGKFYVTHINSLFFNASTWILNSGATDHIICSLDYFDNYRVVHGAKVNLPTGSTFEVKHIGNVRFNKEIWLKDALHIPSFKFNIIYVSKLLQDTCSKLIFMSDQCLIQGVLGTKIGSAELRNGLYLLNELPKPHVDVHSFAVNYIWGSFQVCSLKGERYFLTPVDDYSRYTWLRIMKSKSEARQCIRRFHAMVLTQFGAMIKIFRTDNGAEFNMTDFFDEKGTIHQ